MHVLLALESRVLRVFYRRIIAEASDAPRSFEELRSVTELCRCLNNDIDPGTLLLLDGNLPGLHLPTLVRALGGKGRLERLSILLLVNEKQVPLADEAVVQGAKGYLVRPFANEELCAKIEEISLHQPPAEEAPSAETLCDAVRTGRTYENLPFLFRLPSNVMGSLISESPVDRYAPGVVIVRAGDRVESLRIVTEGEVEIRGTADSEPEIRSSGECIAERAFVRGEPAQVAVTARTSVTTVAIPKEAMVELARRDPAVMDALRSLLVPRGVEEPEGPSEVVGSLSSLSLPELLQHLNAARKTGVLILEDGERSGRIYLDRGDVTDALADGERGERVFRRLAGWLKARFEFKVGSPAATRTITRSTLSLLMELLPAAHQAGAAAV